MNPIRELKSLSKDVNDCNYASRIYSKIKEEIRDEEHHGVFGLLQKQMAYNSNKIEGSILTEAQTELLYNTKCLGVDFNRRKDVEVASGHFSMLNYVFINAFDNCSLDVEMIKIMHRKLLEGSFEFMANGGVPGGFKTKANTVAGIVTSNPKNVYTDLCTLISRFNVYNMSLLEIAKFHINFEKIHPFQDGNGRVGRAIIIYQCIVNNLVPIVIEDINKREYYSSFNDSSRMEDLFISGQETFKSRIHLSGYLC